MKLKDLNLTDYDTLLLDRDGVINVLRPNDYVKCWDEFTFMPDILDMLAIWNKQFNHKFIVTNQRGVGKGVMSETDLIEIHIQMHDVIKTHGGRIDKIYYCTALTEDDNRRKPNNGMFEEILHDYPDVKPEKCVMVGDSDSDMKFAENCHIHGIKI